MSTGDLVAASGMVQATFGVLLGWVMAGFSSGRTELGPFRSRKRVLQCHLDNLFMGALQLGGAAVHPGLPAGAALSLVAGSWLNPQLFLWQALDPAVDLGSGWRLPIVLASFTATTVGWVWTTASYLLR
ncbi:MAG: hypothetical protein FJ148_18135 [Deltaproteobacteria bacterium]|nr:hypothetical protein [Deltaproteobacteria bacterium]